MNGWRNVALFPERVTSAAGPSASEGYAIAGLAGTMGAHNDSLVETLARAMTLACERESMYARLLETPGTRALDTADLSELSRGATTDQGWRAPTLPPGRVHLRCFGTCHILVDGRPAEPCRNGRALALLLYLVHHRGQTSSRDALLDALWPETEARAPDSSLHVAAHALRRYLLLLGMGHDAPTLETHGSGYRLRAPSLWLDVEEFQRACVLGGRLERQGHAGEALAAFTHAADLYQGDFLPDERADWAAFRRESLRDQYLTVLARLSELALAAGDYRACVDYCERALEHDPYGEHIYRTLVLCHGMLGQRGRARWWYERCARVLRADLAVEPQLETTRLYERVVRGDVAGMAPAPAGLAPGLSAE